MVDLAGNYRSQDFRAKMTNLCTKLMIKMRLKMCIKMFCEKLIEIIESEENVPMDKEMAGRKIHAWGLRYAF